jgi:hypothetical protein
MMSDEQGQDADLHMGFDALWGAVVHRTEIDLATLERPKAAFDYPKTLIGQGGVLDTHGANRQTEARFILSRLERQASSGLRRSGTVPVVGCRPGARGGSSRKGSTEEGLPGVPGVGIRQRHIGWNHRLPHEALVMLEGSAGKARSLLSAGAGRG